MGKLKKWSKSLEQIKEGDKPIHLTEEGAAALKEKLARLKASLPHLISEAERTAAYGDRSENAEYKDAKGTLRRTHRQIWSIEDQLKRVVIIKPGPNASHTVGIGSTVTVEIDGAKKIFQIVGSHETDPAKGRISFNSPLGTTLMGHKEGDIITLQAANGLRTYRILEIH